MVTIYRATGICRLILRIASIFKRDTTWYIYNPFRMEVQALKQGFIRKFNRLYKHEMAHEAQLKRYKEKHGERKGTLIFCWLIAWYCVRYGYKNSPFEIEARAAEVA